MPDYLVFHMTDSACRLVGTYLGKETPEEAAREAFVGPGRYLVVDIARVAEFDVEPQPVVRPVGQQ